MTYLEKQPGIASAKQNERYADKLVGDDKGLKILIDDSGVDTTELKMRSLPSKSQSFKTFMLHKSQRTSASNWALNARKGYKSHEKFC